MVLYDEGEQTQGAQLILVGEAEYNDEKADEYNDSTNATDFNNDNNINRAEFSIYIYNNLVEIANELMDDKYGSLPGVADVRAAVGATFVMSTL